MSAHHRLCFEGLWTLADREGRLEDRPERIKVELFPYEPNVELEPMLVDLHRAGFIRRYKARNGRRVIQVVTFLHHQTPHFKEPASELPPPRGHQDSGVVAFGVPDDQKVRILVRDLHRCVKCGAGDRLQIDYIVQRSRGGSGDDANLQTLCKRCNSKKGNRLEKQANSTAPTTKTVEASAIYDASISHSPRVGSPDPESVPDPVPETETESESETLSGVGEKSSAAAARRINGQPQNPDESLRVITKIAHETIALGVRDDDLMEAVKTLCAERHIAYNSTVVRKAIESAEFQRRRPQ